ncbi:ester cyclase [Streptomonospora wellingtoniae]|uniref:Ester cyclase n=1 Tax=Streptomonospora wellingtoniae TaxID=3075544 RepID=A0ABU2KNN6_9ACTN|nr:ester cyclase [Streptomonospora sp. DSM 45055]MDT0300879.1 ester cyclase [Streptomonospora sp. DSM 45055]
MHDDRRRNLLDAWHAAWGNGDVEAFERLLASGYVRHTKTGSEGVESVRSAIESSQKAFPDLRTEILETVEEGAVLALRWQSRGTHTGEFMGVPPTDRMVTVTGASFCRFEGALLAEEWVVWDPRELLSAMNIWALGSRTER